MASKRRIQKCIVVLLSVLLLFSSVSVCVTAEDLGNKTKLYGIYTDNMLFLQNSVAELCGTAESHAIISCKVVNSNNHMISQGQTVAENGAFTLSFATPAGSFEAYRVLLYTNNVLTATLNNVAFGEVWLAGGQSNMNYPLGQDYDYLNTPETILPQSHAEFLRLMVTEIEPTCGHTEKYVPNELQEDYENCQWITAQSVQRNGISAVGFEFGVQLMEKLQVPVAILNISLGGSMIRSWISRTALEESTQAMAYLNKNNAYYSNEEWNPTERSYYSDMSASFNARIYPIRHFKLSGMIWYQGESELMSNASYGEYSMLFDLMQKDYTRLFRYENGLLPIVYSQIVTYGYEADRELQDFNFEYSQMQLSDPTSRASVSVSDVPLSYTDDIHQIHPIKKKPIATRMAYAALGLVYAKHSLYSAPALLDSSVKNGSVYVTLTNVGDGLICTGNTLNGFTICSDDGVYYTAQAEIIAPDTVRIYSDDVTNPVSATYGYSQVNTQGNLYATENGQTVFPCSPFVTNRVENPLYMPQYLWQDCETERMWLNITSGESGYYPIWNTQSCIYTLNDTAAYSGESGLYITSGNYSFGLKQDFEKKLQCKAYPILSYQNNLSRYGGVRFAVKNLSENAVEFTGMNIANSAVRFVSPIITATGKTHITVPADGEWHILELDLNNLVFDNGIACTDKSLIGNVKSFTLSFEGEGEKILCLDEIRFVPNVSETKEPSDEDYKGIKELAEYLFARLKTFLLRIIYLKNSFGYTYENCTPADDLSFITLNQNSVIKVQSTVLQKLNRYEIKYESDDYLKGMLTYFNGIKTVTEDFYLEPADTPTVFTAYIQNALNGKVAFRLKSITLSPLQKETAEFVFYGVSVSYQKMPKDLITVENAYIKAGVSLKWGGALSYFEDLDSDVQAVKDENGKIHVDSLAQDRYQATEVNTHVNLINRNDTGRLVQQSYYGTGACEQYEPGICNNIAWNYNPVQGGNQYNEQSRIIDFRVTNDSIYIKCQPLDWAKPAECISPSYMEATYTLQGKGLRVDCRFTDFSGYPSVTVTQELPAFYPIAPLDTLVTYTGDKPFTGDELTYTKGLIFWPDAGYPNFATNEGWSAFVGEFEDSFGIGLYMPDCQKVLAGIFLPGETQNIQPDSDASTSYIAVVNAHLFQSFAPFTYSYIISSGTAREMQTYFTQVKNQFS